VVPFERFVTPKPVLLNPTFGEASHAVGGADADMIAGDLLLDLKVTSRAKVGAEHLNQLVGYFLLSREHRQSVPTAPEVRRLGLYYARYGYLWLADAAAWTKQPGFPELERWFFAHAAELRDQEVAKRRERVAALRPSTLLGPRPGHVPEQATAAEADAPEVAKPPAAAKPKATARQKGAAPKKPDAKGASE
jgi:hypothetical protein